MRHTKPRPPGPPANAFESPLRTPIPEQRLIPVSSWSLHHAWPPLGGLRHLIFHASTNGFSAAIRRVGRRVLIDEKAFFDWVNSQGTAK